MTTKPTDTRIAGAVVAVTRGTTLPLRPRD